MITLNSQNASKHAHTATKPTWSHYYSQIFFPKDTEISLSIHRQDLSHMETYIGCEQEHGYQSSFTKSFWNDTWTIILLKGKRVFMFSQLGNIFLIAVALIFSMQLFLWWTECEIPGNISLLHHECKSRTVNVLRALTTITLTLKTSKHP